MLSNKIVRDFGHKVDKKSIFHSSAYAAAQNSDKIGASSSGELLTTAKRQAIEEQRKYVRGYQNSKIISSAYRTQRVCSVPPRTAGGTGSLIDKNKNSDSGYSSRTSKDERRNAKVQPVSSKNIQQLSPGPSPAPSRYIPRSVSFKP